MTNDIYAASVPAHLSDGDITDYLYVDGEYVYDPLPEPEPMEPEPIAEECITALEVYVKLD